MMGHYTIRASNATHRFPVTVLRVVFWILFSYLIIFRVDLRMERLGELTPENSGVELKLTYLLMPAIARRLSLGESVSATLPPRDSNTEYTNRS